MIGHRADVREREVTMKPIIVGIDGSQTAITAALWGIDEAISRSVAAAPGLCSQVDASIPG